MTGAQSNLDVSRETMADLEAFAGLVLKWNRSINLISKSSEKDIWERHVADSAQLFDLAEPTGDELWIDIGSGGGFPAIVVSILSRTKFPEISYKLVESDQRKCAFLRTAIRELGLNCSVLEARVEEIDPLEADIISARAFAELADLAGVIARHGKKTSKSLFLKGKSHHVELTKAQESWHIDVIRHPSKTDSTASILEIKGKPIAKAL